MINRLKHYLKVKLNLPARTGGLVPQPEDKRDWVYKPKIGTQVQGSVIDLRPVMPPVTNQGNFNSCTAHAIGSVVEFVLRQEFKIFQDLFRFSEAYQWYWHRVIENRFPQNSGVFLRDGFKVINKFGIVPHHHMAWNTHYTSHPSKGSLASGAIARDFLVPLIGGYFRVKNKDIRQTILNGNPVIFGLGLDRPFMFLSKNSPYYDGWTDSIQYFHAMVVVGLVERDGREYYVVRNSWGSGWADGGHCYVARHFLDNWAFDVWTILKKEDVEK